MSMPVPPFRTSAPSVAEPAVNVSSPVPPVIVSAPSELWSVSFPAPPSSVSPALPPLIVSLPPPPDRTFVPPVPPFSVSLAPPPVNVSFPAPPVIVVATEIAEAFATLFPSSSVSVIEVTSEVGQRAWFALGTVQPVPGVIAICVSANS